MWYIKTSRVKRRRRRPARALDPYCAWWRTRTFKSRKEMNRFIEKYPDNQYKEIYVNNAWGVLYKRMLIIDL